jgi:hypothetical protein
MCNSGQVKTGIYRKSRRDENNLFTYSSCLDGY